jgi:hypothetical protein
MNSSKGVVGHCLGLLLVILFAESSFAGEPAFPVSVRKSGSEICQLEGRELIVDATTGRAALQLSKGFSCELSGTLGNFPAPVVTLASHASLNVSTTSTASAATLNVTLATGFPSSAAGVSCEPDGVDSTFVNVLSGWTGVLCTNCGSSVTRTVSIAHTGGVGIGALRFKAKCTYQGDPAHPRIATTLRDIDSPSVTVARYFPECTAVEQLADPKGLTSAMRQTGGQIIGGPTAGNSVDFTKFTSVFGSAAGTFIAGSPDAADYGFPGTNASSIRLVLNRNRFTALKFRAPNDPVWINVDGSFSFMPGTAYVSTAIAPCPGQFQSDENFPLPSACFGQTKMDVPWRIAAGGDESCRLEPGRMYYLNLIHADRSDLPETTCMTSLGCSQYVRRILSP